MCGIAGLWAPDLAPDERLALVEGMLAVMRSRGPDGTAVWQGDGITLGLTRLAIVAPQEPPRVYCSEDANLHTVVNGEIYNHLELRTLLAARGHRLEPGPDTVVVPHLYEEHGLAFPAHLDGMFAVALWDVRERRLLLARDRAGEKPLFHTAHGGPGGRFAFASQPGALARLPWVRREPAPGALARYLAHGFFAGDDCAFAALRQLPPAHLLEVTAAGARPVRTNLMPSWHGFHDDEGEAELDCRARQPGIFKRLAGAWHHLQPVGLMQAVVGRDHQLLDPSLRRASVVDQQVAVVVLLVADLDVPREPRRVVVVAVAAQRALPVAGFANKLEGAVVGERLNE